MRSIPRTLAAGLILLAASSAQADVVEASSTTMVSVGQQARGAVPGETPKLDTVAPLFEILSVRARDLANPLNIQDLELVFSGWGSYDLGEVRWSSGSTDHFTGDVTTGYVRGSLFSRRLVLRAGREYVAAGAGRMLQIDGGDLLLRLPANFTISAYTGVPVSQRFMARDGEKSWNPAGGDRAYGGRLGWSLPVPGAYGRGFDAGVSYAVVSDDGYYARQDAGLDLRLQYWKGLVLSGTATYSLLAERLAELDLNALWNASDRTFVTFDVRRTAPDLFLSQNSILSVFADANRTDVGAGIRYKVNPALSLGLDYQALIEPTGEGSKTELGHEATARAEWEKGHSRLGGELSYLQAAGLGKAENGYVGVRLFGRQDYTRMFVTADVTSYFLRQEVNGNKVSVEGVVSAGHPLGQGWAVLLAGRAGVNPFMQQQADVMLKLAYNQTYRVREVK